MTTEPALPAWRRITTSESRWPIALLVVVAAGLQTVLPEQVVLGSRWLMPALVVGVLLVLAATHVPFEHETPRRRRFSLVLTALVSVANLGVATRIVVNLVAGHDNAPGMLLVAGAVVWSTNIIAFALWYWQFDRGGPAQRVLGVHQTPDFLFPQMQTPEIDPEWEPRFVDYLYVAFTNATAFSPTDTMPLSRWAKLTMMLQSMISLVTIALVVARAVNVLD